MKVFMQIFFGLALGVTIAIWLVYSSVPIFWEHEEPLQPHVYSITWRSGIFLLALLAISQAFSFLVFRGNRIRKAARNNAAGSRHDSY